VTDIQFAPVHTKFLKITQTGTATGNYWSIHELQIFAANDTAVSAANTAPPAH
jgi:hypothetical protein